MATLHPLLWLWLASAWVLSVGIGVVTASNTAAAAAVAAAGTKNQTKTKITPILKPPPKKYMGGKCACQPTSWEFTLDFSRTDCTVTNFPIGLTGIDSIVCQTTNPPPDQSITPPPPLSNGYPNNNKPRSRIGPGPGEASAARQGIFQLSHVEYIEIVESFEGVNDKKTNQNNNKKRTPVCHHNAPNYHENEPSLFGPFENGHSFTYNSVMKQMKPASATASNTDNALAYNVCLPSSIRIHMYGRNQLGVLGEFDVTLFFSNECTTYPVIAAGNYIGPLTVTAVSAPFPYFCPVLEKDNE